MLNCLRITDLPQVAGLLFPKRVAIMGEMPEPYEWASQLYRTLGEPDRFQKINSLSQWRFE
jgi:hypothetical protein